MKKNKIGSATLTVIILGIISLIYGFSVYSDILHLQTTQDNYELNMRNMFEQEYEEMEKKLR